MTDEGRVSAGGTPTNDRTSIDALGQLTVELAVTAARLAAQWRAEGFGIDVKSAPTDLVTEVDARVERWLAEQIRSRRPGDRILGEEGTSDGETGGSAVRWLIDPIDGTVNFVLGLPQFAVSVAAEVDGTVVAGCVANPMTGQVFRATLGGGAFLDATAGDQTAVPIRLRGPRAVTVDRAVVGTGFGYAAERRARQALVVADLLPQLADIRRLGAASLDLCYVAAGWLDAYFEAGLNPWDYAAGLLIAAEAGCVSSGLQGAPAGDRFCAVAGLDLAPDLFRLLAEIGADSVLLG